jgi:hypothetical protein
MDFITDSYQVFPMAWVPKKQETVLLVFAYAYFQLQQQSPQKKYGFKL